MWPGHCDFASSILASFLHPKQSAEAYHTIWTPEGSPLVVTSRALQRALQERVSIPVELAMRYQNPSIPDAVQRLADQHIEELLMIPLFPHFAMSSFETAVVRVKEVAAKLAPGMRIQVQPPYYDHPDYIAALVASASEYLQKPYDLLLFSFHGIPERHLKKSDPTGCHCLTVPNCCEVASPAHAQCYRAQCFKTVAAFVKAAQVPANKYAVSFQSRLGRDPWLRPYTDFELERFGAEGIKHILVICPAFVSDCLETIEEIGLRGKESFEAAGGEELTRIPCMNEHPKWIEALTKMVASFSGESVRPGSVGPVVR